MISAPVIREITRIVGHEHLVIAQDAMVEYASDGTGLEYMPDAVAFPASDEEISQLLKLATKEGFPVIPRGAGSGMSGGALPVEGGLVLVMTRFNRILSSSSNLICRVEPGVITADLEDAVEAVGLFYPPDPASRDISTIGGNVAECAGGLRAVKYGVTRDYILGLTIVLPTGEIMNTGVETMKGVAGYDLTRLITGSEGTLAVVTAIILRLIPKPEAKKTMTAFFPDVSSAVRTVSQDIIMNKIIPSILEFIDRVSVDCVKEEMDISIPDGALGMLLIEVDGDKASVKQDAERIRDFMQKRGGCLRFESASNSREASGCGEKSANFSSLLTLRPHKISKESLLPGGQHVRNCSTVWEN